MDGSGGPFIPLDESSKGADSPWLLVALLLIFLAFVALIYVTYYM